MKKKIVNVDMDNPIVDFRSGIKRLPKSDIKDFKERYDEHPYIFTLILKVMQSSIITMLNILSLN